MENPALREQEIKDQIDQLPNLLVDHWVADEDEELLEDYIERMEIRHNE